MHIICSFLVFTRKTFELIALLFINKVSVAVNVHQLLVHVMANA